MFVWLLYITSHLNMISSYENLIWFTSSTRVLLWIICVGLTFSSTTIQSKLISLYYYEDIHNGLRCRLYDFYELRSILMISSYDSLHTWPTPQEVVLR